MSFVAVTFALLTKKELKRLSPLFTLHISRIWSCNGTIQTIFHSAITSWNSVYCLNAKLKQKRVSMRALQWLFQLIKHLTNGSNSQRPTALSLNITDRQKILISNKQRPSQVRTSMRITGAPWTSTRREAEYCAGQQPASTLLHSWPRARQDPRTVVWVRCALTELIPYSTTFSSSRLKSMRRRSSPSTPTFAVKMKKHISVTSCQTQENKTNERKKKVVVVSLEQIMTWMIKMRESKEWVLNSQVMPKCYKNNKKRLQRSLESKSRCNSRKSCALWRWLEASRAIDL